MSEETFLYLRTLCLFTRLVHCSSKVNMCTRQMCDFYDNGKWYVCVFVCVCECAQIINPHQSSDVVLVILYQPFFSLLTVPSAPPQTFTAFLSHLQNSAHFQWSPAPSSDLHGILTGYSLLCRRFRDGQEELPIRETLGNDRLQYELKTLYNRTGTEYNCSIAAQTQAGEGPRSAPVYFATPGGE